MHPPLSPFKKKSERIHKSTNSLALCISESPQIGTLNKNKFRVIRLMSRNIVQSFVIVVAAPQLLYESIMIKRSRRGREDVCMKSLF